MASLCGNVMYISLSLSRSLREIKCSKDSFEKWLQLSKTTEKVKFICLLEVDAAIKVPEVSSIRGKRMSDKKAIRASVFLSCKTLIKRIN